MRAKSIRGIALGLFIVVFVIVPVVSAAEVAFPYGETWSGNRYSAASLWLSAHAGGGVSAQQLLKEIVPEQWLLGYDVHLGVAGHYGHRWTATLELGFRGIDALTQDLSEKWESYSMTNTRIGLGLLFSPIVTRHFEVATGARFGLNVHSSSGKRLVQEEGSDWITPVLNEWGGAECFTGGQLNLAVFPGLSTELGLALVADVLLGTGDVKKFDWELDGAPDWSRLSFGIEAQVGYHF